MPDPVWTFRLVIPSYLVDDLFMARAGPHALQRGHGCKMDFTAKLLKKIAYLGVEALAEDAGLAA